MESSAEMLTPSLKALTAPQKHLSRLEERADEFQTEERQNRKGSLYFLAGCFGEFVFLLQHFAAVSLNPDRQSNVSGTFLKSTFFLNTIITIISMAFWNQKQFLSLFLPLSLCTGGAFWAALVPLASFLPSFHPTAPKPSLCVPNTILFLPLCALNAQSLLVLSLALSRSSSFLWWHRSI